MARLNCPACRSKLPVNASFCPKCGRPVTSFDRDRERERKVLQWKIGLPLFGLLLIYAQCDKNAQDSGTSVSGSALTAEPISPQAPVVPHSAPELSPPPSTASTEGYQSLVANIWPGKKLYLRTDKSFIGTVVDAGEHTFEDGTRRKGVLIRFKDGTDDWLPRETVKQIYVTRQ
jgi:hypothetical protein